MTIHSRAVPHPYLYVTCLKKRKFFFFLFFVFSWRRFLGEISLYFNRWIPCYNSVLNCSICTLIFLERYISKPNGGSSSSYPSIHERPSVTLYTIDTWTGEKWWWHRRTTTATKWRLKGLRRRGVLSILWHVRKITEWWTCTLSGIVWPTEGSSNCLYHYTHWDQGTAPRRFSLTENMSKKGSFYKSLSLS